MSKPMIAGRNAAAAESAQALPSNRWVLASLSLAVLLSSLGTSIANVALPTLTRAFSATLQEVQWVVLAYLLAATTLSVSAGRLGDLIGRRRLLVAGVWLFTLASLACALVPSLWMLVAARAVQGIGAAVMMALAMALVGGAMPKARTGSAMGLLATTSALGTALGPSLGGALIAWLGWRAIFFVNVPLGIVALLIARYCLPADNRRSASDRAGLDRMGTLLLALSLGAYALAMTLGRDGFGALNAALLLAAALGIGLFVRTEARAASPLIRLSMLRERALSAALAMSALVMTVMMATLVVGPFYLAGALGLDAARVGLAMSAGPLIVALTGLPAGRIADRYGAPRMVRIGLAILGLGCLLLSMMPASGGVFGYVAALGIATIGYSLFQTANNTAIMAEVGAEQRGVVSGMLNLSRNLGIITGASAMGAVFALGAGTVDIAAAQPAAVAAGMRITFAVAALLIVAALALAMSRAAARD